MPEFNPIQTNQMPRREKLIQRLWELIRPVLWGLSPWFARRWRLGVLRYIVKMGGGGHENIAQYRFAFSEMSYRLSVEIVVNGGAVESGGRCVGILFR